MDIQVLKCVLVYTSVKMSVSIIKMCISMRYNC